MKIRGYWWFMRRVFRLISILMFTIAFILVPCFSASAAGEEYYLVSGRIYNDGSGEIDRVDRVDGITSVRTQAGEEYALFACNEDGHEIYMTPIAVNFELDPRAGGGYSEYSEFAALIPYDSRITSFILYNDLFYELDAAYTDEGAQMEIAYFTAEETDGGYMLRWSVELYDEDDSYLIEYDVIAMSRSTGESNVLAYRTQDTSLFVPYDWLEPNDTVVFMLKSNDSRTTLTEVSGVFDTPDGEERTIGDADTQWPDEGPSYEDPDYSDYGDSADDEDYGEDDKKMSDKEFYTIIAVIASVVVTIPAIIIIIVVARKKKK